MFPYPNRVISPSSSLLYLRANVYELHISDMLLKELTQRFSYDDDSNLMTFVYEFLHAPVIEITKSNPQLYFNPINKFISKYLNVDNDSMIAGMMGSILCNKKYINIHLVGEKTITSKYIGVFDGGYNIYERMKKT